MSHAYIIGIHSTAFGRFADRSFRDLSREAILGAITDADVSGDAIESVWFGNVLMDYWGQHSTRGQFTLVPLEEEGVLRRRVAITNVESGCATGSMALHGAIKDILSGTSEISLAVGVEKTFRPDVPKEQTLAMYRAGENALDPHETLAEYRSLAQQGGRELEFGPDRTMFMDTYAAQAAFHMTQFGTTQAQLAAVAAKNHTNGAANPLAQYRFSMTVDEVLADREVSYPLTRSMCAPVGDGAAAAIVCSEGVLARLPTTVRDRAVRVAAAVLRSGVYRSPHEPSLTRETADRAYQLASIAPEDIDVAEVHDATAFGEIYQAEMLRFCDIGQGGPLAESGATAIDGAIPLNTSGGLLSKGHPIAASGLSMTHEIVTQLRSEAGDRQVRGARTGMVENGGGIMGLEEAACCVTLLDRR
ncbi:thiolase family protein [Kribbia dieselivorans]|uniref:thiolase family protein n=1 Tax=Kribbia dieselivorans TaxID=331526 RepID=UPI0008381E67|nr:thiolase family protein [Kribbia dieselivorans]